MNNENRKFIPYKLLSKRNIIKAAKEIKKINKTNLEDFVIDEFRNYFRNEVQNEPLSFSIKTAALRGISNAVILVHFNKYPKDCWFENTYFTIQRTVRGGIWASSCLCIC